MLEPGTSACESLLRNLLALVKELGESAAACGFFGVLVGFFFNYLLIYPSKATIKPSFIAFSQSDPPPDLIPLPPNKL